MRQGLRITGLTMLVATGLAGCASAPLPTVSEIEICSAGYCSSDSDRQPSPEQLLASFQQLLSANVDEKVLLCKADPETRKCDSVGVCHLVVGGIIPGAGCSKEIVFRKTARGEEPSQLAVEADMPKTWYGTPLYCDTLDGTLTVRSRSDISIELGPGFCNWMVIASMSASMSFAVDSVDFDNGEVGAFWKSSITGMGNGSGTGYMLLQFPKHSMPGTVDATSSVRPDE